MQAYPDICEQGFRTYYVHMNAWMYMYVCMYTFTETNTQHAKSSSNRNRRTWDDSKQELIELEEKNERNMSAGSSVRVYVRVYGGRC